MKKSTRGGRDLSGLFTIISVYGVVGLLAWLAATQLSWATVPVCIWAIGIPATFFVLWAILKEVPTMVLEYIAVLFWPVAAVILLVAGFVSWLLRHDSVDYD